MKLHRTHRKLIAAAITALAAVAGVELAPDQVNELAAAAAILIGLIFVERLPNDPA